MGCAWQEQLLNILQQKTNVWCPCADCALRVLCSLFETDSAFIRVITGDLSKPGFLSPVLQSIPSSVSHFKFKGGPCCIAAMYDTSTTFTALHFIALIAHFIVIVDCTFYCFYNTQYSRVVSADAVSDAHARKFAMALCTCIWLVRMLTFSPIHMIAAGETVLL